MDKDSVLRALWLAVNANGGTLRIGPSTLEKYPGDKEVFVTSYMDKSFGELVIVSHQRDGQA